MVGSQSDLQSGMADVEGRPIPRCRTIMVEHREQSSHENFQAFSGEQKARFSAKSCWPSSETRRIARAGPE